MSTSVPTAIYGYAAACARRRTVVKSRSTRASPPTYDAAGADHAARPANGAGGRVATGDTVYRHGWILHPGRTNPTGQRSSRQPRPCACSAEKAHGPTTLAEYCLAAHGTYPASAWALLGEDSPLLRRPRLPRRRWRRSASGRAAARSPGRDRRFPLARRAAELHRIARLAAGRGRLRLALFATPTPACTTPVKVGRNNLRRASPCYSRRQRLQQPRDRRFRHASPRRPGRHAARLFAHRATTSARAPLCPGRRG